MIAKPRKGDRVRYARRTWTVHKIDRDALTLVNADGTEFVGIGWRDPRVQELPA